MRRKDKKFLKIDQSGLVLAARRLSDESLLLNRLHPVAGESGCGGLVKRGGKE